MLIRINFRERSHTLSPIMDEFLRNVNLSSLRGLVLGRFVSGGYVPGGLSPGGSRKKSPPVDDLYV